MRPRAVGLLVVLAVLAACAPEPGPRTSAQDTVVIALREEPETLFAPWATSAEAQAVIGALSDGLVVEDEKGELEPRLAERVPSLENGDAVLTKLPDGRGALTVRFRLRESARWHDGTPVRPADIRFGWLLLSNRETRAVQYSTASRIQDVRAADERTVEVVYKPGELDPRFALCCNGFVLPEALLRDVPPAKLAESGFVRAPMYAGPFLLKERQGNVSITLERSLHYALGPAPLRTVVFVFRPDPDVLLGDLSAHRVDLAAGLYGVDRAGALATLDRRGVRAVYTPALALEHLDFNLRDPDDLTKPHPILGDRAVRAALAMAIDRAKLARNATAGRLEPPASYLVSPAWAAAKPADLTLYAHDPAAAQRALDGAGWRPGADGVRERDGRRLALRMLVASGNAQRDQAAAQIVADLARIGVVVATEPASMSSLIDGAGPGPLAKGRFDLALYTWLGEREPYGWSLVYQRSQVPSAANGFAGQNYPGWADDRFTRLAEEAAGTLERDTRRERYLEMQRIWTAALPALPLYQRVHIDVADARLRELRPQPTRAPITWNVARWSFGGV